MWGKQTKKCRNTLGFHLMPPSQANPTGERAPPRGAPVSTTGVAAPETIGRYRLLSKIAKGGMAEVYAARSYGAHGFEKTVALKRILPKFGRDPQFVRMMVDEAKISVLLNHPNIAQVFELGEQEGDYFIVMEFVPGQSLSAVVKRLKEDSVKLPVLDACFIVVELLQGLHAAHIQQDAAGHPAHIIHRDVSPQNTLVSFDGHVKVIDFGIARARDRLEATEIGTIKGKLRYLAPEMIDPGRFTEEGDFDHRVDVFAAGIVLWELIAARPLFPGDDELKVYDDITDGHTPDLAKEGRCDVALMKILFKALERRLDHRYPTAEAFADDLRAYVYRSDPSFTHKRVAGILDKLFTEEKAELLALERGAFVGASGAVAKAPGAAPSMKPLPTTLPESHTRSDRQLAASAANAAASASANAANRDDGATMVADVNDLDPRGELPRQREVTVMTLVSRQQVIEGGKAQSDSSGVFSMADEATLTVSAEAVANMKGALGLGGAAAKMTPIGGRPASPPPRPSMPLGSGAAIGSLVSRPAADETPMTSRRVGEAPPAKDAGRQRVVAGSAIFGVLLALGIVAVVDRVRPPPATTTTATTAITATTTPTTATPTPEPAPVPVVASANVELRVDVVPASATVSINGTPTGVGATVVPGVPVTVAITADGYETIEQVLTPAADTPFVVKATLVAMLPSPAPSPAPSPPPAPTTPKKIPTTTPTTTTTTTTPTTAAKTMGQLQLKTQPYWANVTIDGKALDDTTPITVQLSPGRHDVVVSHPPRGLTKKLKVVIVGNETTSRTVVFDD
jgi:serine/threonine protein kinase